MLVIDIDNETSWSREKLGPYVVAVKLLVRFEIGIDVRVRHCTLMVFDEAFKNTIPAFLANLRNEAEEVLVCRQPMSQGHFLFIRKSGGVQYPDVR